MNSILKNIHEQILNGFIIHVFVNIPIAILAFIYNSNFGVSRLVILDHPILAFFIHLFAISTIYIIVNLITGNAEKRNVNIILLAIVCILSIILISFIHAKYFVFIKNENIWFYSGFDISDKCRDILKANNIDFSSFTPIEFYENCQYDANFTWPNRFKLEILFAFLFSIALISLYRLFKLFFSTNLNRSLSNVSTNPLNQKILPEISTGVVIDTYSHKDSEKEAIIKYEQPIVVILTAIKQEYSAVKSHLVEIKKITKNDSIYEEGLFVFNNMEIAKVFIRECGAKNVIASQESERAIQYFKPDVMLFVGIAGSRKPKDFSIGDVIFPEKVYSYESGRAERERKLARPDFGLMSYVLLEKAKFERNREDWKVLLKCKNSKDVIADIGVIASGEYLIEHYDSDIGKDITANYNDTSAVEMEGFGFAKAANRQGRETNKVMIGIIRGISDILEFTSSDSKMEINDRRPENAKEFASKTAAAFAFWLIFKTYEK
jgi:nucleoside phosphorylase